MSRPPRGVGVGELVDRARAGDVRALARLVTLVESGDCAQPALAAALGPHPDPGAGWLVGLTGAPGVGKSTLVDALIRELRTDGERVAVLAVDPSSPYSGGAFLGDRIRMQAHATDPGVYIRSMSARGHLGGLAASAPRVVRVLAGIGFDVVLVETVGVGQAEVEVAALADTTIVLVAPGMGDAIQAVKAGILEVADVLVVTKSDRGGAAETVRDLRGALAGRTGEGWLPPVVPAAATLGQGVGEVLAAARRHRRWLAGADRLAEVRRSRAAAEIEAAALAELRSRAAVPGAEPGSRLADLARLVADGRLDPERAARELLAGG